jgi:hypothetical protein
MRPRWQLHVTGVPCLSGEEFSLFTYQSERFNTRATHIQCCPREPRTTAADHQQMLTE